MRLASLARACLALALASLVTVAPALADDKAACLDGIAMIKAELAKPAPEAFVWPSASWGRASSTSAWTRSATPGGP